ncbi:MAG: methionyl-tRNA formyltransferase [Candidatus Nitrospinota bacterium M3_3B_026]
MAAPLRVIFMGTPDFAVPTLRELAASPAFRVEAVVTQPDRPRGRGRRLSASPVKNTASELGLKILQPSMARDPETVEAFSAIAPDYIVVVAYGQILPKAILDIPKIAPVNLHASLLPRWRGAAPIHRAILAGDEKTGVCAMIMEETLDTGGVLECESTPITDDDTFGSLHDRLSAMGAGLMAKALKDYAEGRIAPAPQDDAKATYAEKLTPGDFFIDWTKHAREVSRKIRGLSPFPGAMAALGGRKLKILFAATVEGAGRGAPGEIVAVTKEGIEAACGSGSVLITRVKPEGKGEMTAHAWTLGARVEAGDRFGG